MLTMNSGYVLELEVINGSNLVIPSHRIPTGLYVLVSTAYGQQKTAIKTIMADRSVLWNESLVIQGRPLKFPHWLMPIFPGNSKAVYLEIRASFETVMLGRGELVRRIETNLEELLAHRNQFELNGSRLNITDMTTSRTKLYNDEKSPLSGVKTQCPSLLLRARRIKPPRPADHTASGLIQTSEIDFMTDAANEAYAVYRKSNDRNDLNIAFQRFQEVLDRCPDGHPQRSSALSNLAHVILYDFSKGLESDTDYVISLFRSALELCPEGHPDHPISILNLCKALHQRHLHRQDSVNLREVVKLYLDLLPLCVDGSYLQLCVIEECNSLPRNPSDASILLRLKVIDLCRLHCQYHARSLNRLAGDLYARFEASGDTDDINEAVRLSREALTECPSDGRSFFLSVLAYTLKLRFHHLHDPDDINECISLNRGALDLRPPGHPSRQKSLNNLARALKARYDQYSDIADFEESLHLARDAHDLRSGNSPPPHEHSQEHVDLRQNQSAHPPETDEGPKRQPPPESLTSDRESRPRARNIVIFGKAGSGKSSVINAIAQRRLAETSSNAAGCTSRYQGHEINISGETFVLFDTVGLDEGTAGTVPAAEAEAKLKSLLRGLTSPRQNGISLLVYCVGCGKDSGKIASLLRNYDLVYSKICQKKVPIVVVVTGLESYEPNMESWWSANENLFAKCGMNFTDYACVTTLGDNPDTTEPERLRIAESRESLRTLIVQNSVEWEGDATWFNLSILGVQNVIGGRNGKRSSPPTLIICDPSQKEVQVAHGFYGIIKTFSMEIGGATYQIHCVPQPESPIPTSSVVADLLIYYAPADEVSMASQRFNTFCAAYRGDAVPVIVVVQGLNDSKAAQEWVERHLAQNSVGHLFSTFFPAGDVRDLNAEQELQGLIQRSCLIRNEGKGSGIRSSIVNLLGR